MNVWSHSMRDIFQGADKTVVWLGAGGRWAWTFNPEGNTT